MNTDFRVSIGFFDHLKTRRLRRKFGADGIYSLLRLWCFAATNYPDGLFPVDDAEIITEIIEWRGDPEAFWQALIQIGFIDNAEDKSAFLIHDWKEHNGYAAHAKERSESARKAACAKHAARMRPADKPQCETDAPRMPTADIPQCAFPAPSPSPSPSPLPNPSPDPIPSRKKKKQLAREVDQEFIQELAAKYTNVNVDSEADLAREWIEDHPGRKFSRSFLHGWVKRSSEKLPQAEKPPKRMFTNPITGETYELADWATEETELFGIKIAEEMAAEDEAKRREEEAKNAKNVA